MEINLDDLKLGQIKELAKFACGNVEKTNLHPFVGEYVIARCYAAGVHAGEVVSVDGENVILKNSRRLWSWKAKDGVALSGVAQFGIKSDSKVDVVNPQIYLTGVCELIPMTPAARKTIDEK